MGAPTVDYEMIADGYKITSGPNGFRAQASFVVAWALAFQFHDEIMGYATAAAVGPLTYNTPWQFPGSSTARLYASSCEITPFALANGASAIGASLGMAPGEYWSHVRFDVTFETPTFAQSAADDPGNQNQLDPAAPIYNCEQSIHVGSRSEDRPKDAYQFPGGITPKKPKKDVTIYTGETNITLRWPFVPFVPWKRYRPFVNAVNSTAFLDCGVGELLFQGVQIEPASGPQGTLGKSVTVQLLVNEHDWNKFTHPDTGVPSLIETTGGVKPYAYIEFRQLLFPSDI